MKSVCLVVQNGYPFDVRIRKYAQVLVRGGHKVFVMACRMPGQRYHESIDGVEVYRIPPSRSRSGKLRYVYEYCVFMVFAFFQLNALDFRHRFDVVHVNTLPDFLVFCALIQKWTGRTVILDMHEVMPEFFMSKYSRRSQSTLVRLLLMIEKASMRFADRVITVNDAIKDLFERRALPKGSVEVVMNTADSSVVKQFDKKTHPGFNCVYHGTITDLYGLDFAITAFARACKDQPDMRFHIFGDGPQLSELKELARTLKIEGHVCFHGFVPHQAMWEKLAEMDLGILAFRKDVFMDLSFSNKLAEYVYLKIPVVHSNLNSVRHYFDDRQILYFQAGDSDDLAGKILYARAHKDLMQRQAEYAYSRYSLIDWGVMSKRYLQIIEGKSRTVAA